MYTVDIHNEIIDIIISYGVSQLVPCPVLVIFIHRNYYSVIDYFYRYPVYFIEFDIFQRVFLLFNSSII